LGIVPELDWTVEALFDLYFDSAECWIRRPKAYLIADDATWHALLRAFRPATESVEACEVAAWLTCGLVWERPLPFRGCNDAVAALFLGALMLEICPEWTTPEDLFAIFRLVSSRRPAEEALRHKAAGVLVQRVCEHARRLVGAS
jgi:hypothetical protein